jgi:hypothetical protein
MIKKVPIIDITPQQYKRGQEKAYEKRAVKIVPKKLLVYPSKKKVRMIKTLTYGPFYTEKPFIEGLLVSPIGKGIPQNYCCVQVDPEEPVRHITRRPYVRADGTHNPNIGRRSTTLKWFMPNREYIIVPKSYVKK